MQADNQNTSAIPGTIPLDEPPKTSRQPKAMVAVAMQGGGKTYTTMRELELYQ